MDDEYSLEVPKACNNDIITNTKKFLVENPRLVELQGLSDRSLKNPDMPLLHFESARATGGGEVEKYYISLEKKAALLLFKDEKAARRVIKENYFLIEDSIVTATPPSPHLWNFSKTAAHLADCKITGGKSEQALKDTLVTLFEADKYNGTSVTVSVVFLDKSNSEATVVFESLVDALLVIDKYKGKNIKLNDLVLGKLTGLTEPPEESVESEEKDDNSLTVKKADLKLPVDQIKNLARELGLDVDIERRSKTFKFSSKDPMMIAKLMAAINVKQEQTKASGKGGTVQKKDDVKPPQVERYSSKETGDSDSEESSESDSSSSEEEEATTPAATAPTTSKNKKTKNKNKAQAGKETTAEPSGKKKGKQKKDKGAEAGKDEGKKASGPQAVGSGEPGGKAVSKEKTPSFFVPKNRVQSGTTVAVLQAKAREGGFDVKISDKGKTFMITGENFSAVKKFYHLVNEEGNKGPGPQEQKQQHQQQGKKPQHPTAAGRINALRVPKQEVSPWSANQLQGAVKSLGIEVIVTEIPDQFIFTGEDSDDLRKFIAKIKATSRKLNFAK